MAWRCSKKSTSELLDYYKCVRHEINYKLNLSLPFFKPVLALVRFLKLNIL